jgi:hypothetical protein
VPFRKKALTSSSLPERLQRQIDAVRAGRASSIALDDSGLTEVPDEIRELEGLKFLDVAADGIKTLPPWLGDLPSLEKINTVYHPMSAIPALPNIQWAINAETIIRCDETLDPAKIYWLSIKPQASIQAVLKRSNLLKTECLGSPGYRYRAK